MTLTAIARFPWLRIEVDGIEVPAKFSFRSSHGYDLQVSEAVVSLPNVPSWINYWSVVGIRAGANQGSAQTRFVGFVIEFDYTLWPREVQLVCRGPLIRAQLVECSTSGGVDLSASGAGQTDQAMVQQLLTAGGLTNPGPVNLTIGGLGRTLGTVATTYYVWAEAQKALDFINQLDAVCLGYRTFDTPAGGIIRTQISANPATTAALTFTEGVDIFSASPQVTVLDTKNRAQVTGYDDGTGGGPFAYAVSQSNPLMPFSVTEQTSSNLIESATTGGTGISAQEVAEWRLGEINRAIGKYQFVTPRDEQLIPGMTIAIISPNRLGISQNFWVQHVDVEIDANGQFSQQIVAITGLTGVPGSGSTNTIGTPDGGIIGTGSGGTAGPGDGTPITGGGGSQGGTPPAGTPPLADFTLDIQSESVLIAGVATTIYEVQGTSTSSGTSAPLAGYAWSTSAGSPASGSEDTFVFALTSLAGPPFVTLVVTDSAGATTTVVHPVQAPTGSQIVTRQLFLAGTDCLEAFDGVAWHTHSETNATVVANTSAWGDSGLGVGGVWASDAALSAISFVDVFAHAPVTALWAETNVAPSRLLAGSAVGGIAVSYDSGATWTVATTVPGAIEVLRCIISGSHPRQWFALTTAGLYRSDNAGAGWVTVLSAAAGETFTDVVLSFARNMIVMAGGRQMIDFLGNAQTLPGGFGDPIAICAHLRKDRFYVMDGSGHTAYHATDAATSLTAGANLPGGTAQPRGLWRDGRVVDLMYIAAGTGGVYKSISGLKTGGYYALRTPGTGSAPAGAVYTQVGAGGTLVAPNLTSPISVLSSTSSKALTLWNGSSNDAPPQNWLEASFNDSGWGAAVHVTGGGVPTPSNGSTQIWAEQPPLALDEQVLIRTTFTVPATGKVRTATIFFAAEWFLGIWLNGVYVPGSANGNGLTVSLPASTVKNGTNLLGVHAYTPLSPSSPAFMNFKLDIT